MKKINVKIVNKSINKLPAYSKVGDAGMDIRSNNDVDIVAGETVMVPTGLYVQIPEGYEIQVRPRSGLAIKSQITVLNAPGTIDSNYRGEICVILHNACQVKGSVFHVNLGDRIAQLVLQKVPIINWELVDELDESNRGTEGFGDSGIK